MAFLGQNLVIRHKDGAGNTDRQVTIWTEPGIEENWTKALNIITFPKSKDNQSIEEGKSDSKILDLLKDAEHRITFDGYLADSTGATSGQYGYGDSSPTAPGKRNDLRDIFFAGGQFEFDYEGTTYTGNSDQVSVTRMATEGNESGGIYAEFSVKLTLIVGVNLTS